jgi:hypothetical protein
MAPAILGTVASGMPANITFVIGGRIAVSDKVLAVSLQRHRNGLTGKEWMDARNPNVLRCEWDGERPHQPQDRMLGRGIQLGLFKA